MLAKEISENLRLLNGIKCPKYHEYLPMLSGLFCSLCYSDHLDDSKIPKVPYNQSWVSYDSENFYELVLADTLERIETKIGLEETLTAVMI